MDITHLTPDAEGSIEWPSFSNDKKAVVTLGAFDGMHLGHQAVIKRVVELAQWVLTWRRSPVPPLSPSRNRAPWPGPRQ